MKQNYQSVQISRMIYNLKKAYGQYVVITRTTTGNFNSTTGKQDVTSVNFTVNNAIVLATRQFRDFAYDLSYVAANKNFTYGAHYDTVERVVIIDRKDMPPDFESSANDRMTVNGQIYDCKESKDFEINTLYIFTLKGVIHES